LKETEKGLFLACMQTVLAKMRGLLYAPKNQEKNTVLARTCEAYWSSASETNDNESEGRDCYYSRKIELQHARVAPIDSRHWLGKRLVVE
jgi:hypothetical protein